MPFVIVDHRVPGVECDFVGSETSWRAPLTEHMIRLGHRRIAHMPGGPGLYTTGQRLQGFLDTMRGAGIEVDPSLIVDGEYEGEPAYAEAMRLMTRPDRPTAILAANNVMALGALQAINDLDFDAKTSPSPRSTTCPGAMSSSRASPWWCSRWTSWRGSPARAARADRASGRPRPAPREHILVPQLVVGTELRAPVTLSQKIAWVDTYASVSRSHFPRPRRRIPV